jgi:hypothetical protein
MDIKIECACGQPFEFDVEPVNGQMPCEVKCPACGTDATAQANVVIGLQLPQKPAVPPQSAPPLAVRINRSNTPPASAPVAPERMAPLPARTAAKPKKNPADNAFRNGLIGAAVGAVIGMIGWFLLIAGTGYAIGYAAWGVGAITGLGARIFGGEGGSKLGLIASLFAIFAIIGGQYLGVRSLAQSVIGKAAVASYQKESAYAKQVVAAKTDDELKTLIAQQDGETSSGVTDFHLQLFKQQELPKLQTLADGEPSQAEFVSQIRKKANSFDFQMRVLGESFGFLMILWLFLGVSSAYKIGSGSNQ